MLYIAMNPDAGVVMPEHAWPVHPSHDRGIQGQKMRKKATAGERILASMKQITKWAEGDQSPARLTTIPSIDVRKIRRRLKMTQTEFALKFGLPAAVVSNWEQGRNTPDTAARVLLAGIDWHPEAVEDTR